MIDELGLDLVEWGSLALPQSPERAFVCTTDVSRITPNSVASRHIHGIWYMVRWYIIRVYTYIHICVCVGGLGFEFRVFVAGWRHALRSEWPFIIIIHVQDKLPSIIIIIKINCISIHLQYMA